MGNNASRLSYEQQIELVKKANFKERELLAFWNHFSSLNKDGSGFLVPREFFDIAGIEDNPLVDRIVAVFDTNDDGRVSFMEFLVGLSRLATDINQSERIKFVFDVYDTNKDGFLTNADLFKSIKAMVGSNLTDIQLQQCVDRAIRDADHNGDGRLSYAEFAQAIQHMDVATQLKLDYRSALDSPGRFF